MISYNEALALTLQQATALSPQQLPLQQVLGYVCANNVLCPCAIPALNNSTMDGFALRAAESKASAELTVVGSIAAGDAPDAQSALRSPAGSAWEIMTGGAIPRSYDAVIPIEEVSIVSHNAKGFPTRIRLNQGVKAGKFVRDAGSDFAQGDIIVKQGEVINANHIMALAAAGIGALAVMPKPKIALLNTGKELVSDPQLALKPGQIRNSNGPFLAAAIKTCHGELIQQQSFGDDPEDFQQALAQIVEQQPDIIISTGAVSKGRYDFVSQSLQALGAEILFHRIKMRPGHPLLVAKFPQGSCYFGLPGNPNSAVVGFRFFVYALMRQLQGQAPESLLSGQISADFRRGHKESRNNKNQKPTNNIKQGILFRLFYKAVASLDAKGQTLITLLDGQASYRMKPLLQANCWAVLTETQQCWSKGDQICFVPTFSEQ